MNSPLLTLSWNSILGVHSFKVSSMITLFAFCFSVDSVLTSRQLPTSNAVLTAIVYSLIMHSSSAQRTVPNSLRYQNHAVSVRCNYKRDIPGAYYKDFDDALAVHKFRTMGKALDACDISKSSIQPPVIYHYKAVNIVRSRIVLIISCCVNFHA